MVTVTERAAEELRAKLLDLDSAPEVGLRLMPTPSGKFLLLLDTELSGDHVVEYQGCKVLIVGIEYIRALEGATVDCCETRNGTMLFMSQE
jgi:Fe-S cluster assembly iron-binding protein IscA